MENREIEFRAWNKQKEEWITEDFLISDNGLNVYVGYNCDRVNAKISQYTGLKDKNSEKIFEGDICQKLESMKSKVISKCKVIYTEDRFILEWITKSWFNDILRNHCDELEVIGNIFENPEFLV